MHCTIWEHHSRGPWCGQCFLKLYSETTMNMIISCIFTTLWSLQRTFIGFKLYNITAIVVSRYTEEETKSREVIQYVTLWYFQDFNLRSRTSVFSLPPQMSVHCSLPIILQCERFWPNKFQELEVKWVYVGGGETPGGVVTESSQCLLLLSFTPNPHPRSLIPQRD